MSNRGFDRGTRNPFDFLDSLLMDWESRNFDRSARAHERVLNAQRRVADARYDAEEAQYRLTVRQLERAWELEERVLLQAFRRQELMAGIAEQRVRLSAPAAAKLPAPQRALPPAVQPEVTEDEIESAAARYAFQLHGLSAADKRTALARIGAELQRKDPYIAAEIERRMARLLEHAR